MFTHFTLIPRTVFGTKYNGTQESRNLIIGQTHMTGTPARWIVAPDKDHSGFEVDYGDEGTTEIAVGDYVTIEDGKVYVYDGADFEGSFRPLV